MDGTEFDDFYHATSHRLLRYVYALVGDLETAQDLTQEVYVRAWQHWRRLTGYDNAEAWLRLVATRLSKDRWRRLGVRHRVHAGLRPAVAPAPSENTVLLVTALRRLPAAHRRALTLHYLMDLPIADIAEETGVSIGTVKSWLSRGRAELGAALGAPTETVRGQSNV